MSRVFNISSATDAVPLDASGRGNVMFTVTNATGRALRGRFKIKPLDAVGGDAIAIEGEPERNFNANDTQQVSVRLNMPPGTKEGKYRFRLDGVNVDNPDDDFTEGPALAVEVKGAPAPKKSIPWWIYAVAALVLVVGGVVGYLFTQRSVELIAVSGPYEAARQQLEGLGLAVEKVEEPSATVAAGQVIRQSPTPAEKPKVKKGSTVTLTVAAAPSTPAAPTNPFVGNWVNKDKNARGVVRLDITQAGDAIKVHAYGKCSPTDCDWGAQDATRVGNQLVSIWDQGFVLRKMTITASGGELNMSLDSNYRDNRPSQHAAETFAHPMPRMLNELEVRRLQHR